MRRRERRARILVVEDENIIALDIQQTLTSLGYTVCGIVDNGEAAIQRALHERPDLVLMDVRIRGTMDGVEAARRIRERVDVPIVFLTAFADEATLTRAREAAAFGYVLKPFDDRDLQASIVMALAKHEAFAELEVRVQERTQLLSEAVRARDEFLSIAAHELKTPLTTLGLQLELLQQLLHELVKPGMEERVSKRLATLRRQGDRLDQLVDHLLDISRLDSGSLRLELEDVDLVRVVNDVAAGLRDKAVPGRPGSELRLELPDRVVGRWDAVRLEQVVTNLIANAVKYGESKPIVVRIETDDDRARLSVQDHGIGIAPEDQGRIFERFERAVSSRHYGGLGLGLFIVHRIVTAMGGVISVTSQPQQGATFVVDLPRRPLDI